MSTFSIEQFPGSADLSAAFAIREEVFVREQAVPLDLEIDGLDPEAFHYLGFVDNVPVATARTRIVAGGDAKIERVAVLQEHRGSRLGFQLMRRIVDDLDAFGIDSTLHAQVSVRGFYEGLGYHAIGDIFDDAGIPHIRMDRSAGTAFSRPA